MYKMDLKVKMPPLVCCIASFSSTVRCSKLIYSSDRRSYLRRSAAEVGQPQALNVGRELVIFYLQSLPFPPSSGQTLPNHLNYTPHRDYSQSCHYVSYVLEHSHINAASCRAGPTTLKAPKMSDSSSTNANLPTNKKINAISGKISGLDLDGHDLPPSPAPSSPRSGRQYAIATDLVFSEGNDQYNASSVPIYQVLRTNAFEL